MLRIMECSGIFQNYSFPLPLTETGSDFFQCLLWESGRTSKSKSHNIVGVPLWLGPPGIFTLRHVRAELPTIRQLQFRLLYHSTGSLEGFHSRVSVPMSQDSPNLPAWLSNLSGGTLPCVLTSLMPPGKVDFFQSVQLFTCCWSECWFPSPLHIELEIRSLKSSFQS